MSSDRPYGAPTGTFGSGDFMINLWYLLGWLVDQGGVVNKKKVPYIAGCLLSVLEIKLHRSRWTPATWGSIAILCDCPVCHRID